jgi:hypothetical protein
LEFFFRGVDADLTGTWTTKSRKVFTGPGFYDPINDKFIEPSVTGISYSFTDDGHFEQAYYRAISNPTTPSCPKGILQFQHGTFEKTSNGSLILSPYGVDGRQLLSDPCGSPNTLYTRYVQKEIFKRYEVLTDPYSNVQRLNLYAFDGAPLNPMYLAYKPPQMLPTQTLNPTTSNSAKSTGTSKVKRSFKDHEDLEVPLNKRAQMHQRQSTRADWLWWFGVGITAIGGVGYVCF